MECGKCNLKKEDRICLQENGKGMTKCPTVHELEIMATALEKYLFPELNKFARQASIQEAECYVNRHLKPYIIHPAKPRVQEICEFAKKMNYKKLELAFCAGFIKEARILTDILEIQGFEVVSIICKSGHIAKEKIDLKENENIYIGNFESICNPIGQALFLNKSKTEFNILMGLCVGHDSMFFKYSETLTTVFATKDRVLGHNPVAALYTSGSYYQRLMKKGF
jgi:uncharacterized metal-binding protein